jgi:hypothetical protein
VRQGTPRDWLHFIVSLLCHDIGYVRGVCLSDGNGRYVSNEQGDLQIVAQVSRKRLVADHTIFISLRGNRA